MSCKHGNWEPCDECEAEEKELHKTFEAGKKEGWKACETCHGIVDGVHQQHAAAKTRIEELERENNELLADAMRYRWIKEQSDGKPFYFHAIRHKHAENLDAAIDAALAKVRKP